MNLRYFLVIIMLKNIYCYHPNRRTQTSSTNNFNNLKSKTADPVIPARYKIKSTANYGGTTTQSFPAEYFPAVEYPESVVASSKPFYLSASPFPNDVKSTFNSLVAKGNNIANTATDYSWTQKEKSNEKVPATSQKVEENEITDTKGNEINVIDKGTIETLHKDITTLDVKDYFEKEKIPNSHNDMDQMFTNGTSTEHSAECKDMNYVISLINDLDEVMKNLTSTGTPECNESDNSTVHTFQSECSNEFKLSSDMTPNNDSIIELNGNSLYKQEHPERIRNPLFEDSNTNDALTSLTSLLNKFITNVTSVGDMQSDFCSIGPIANETNSSCTAS